MRFQLVCVVLLATVCITLSADNENARLLASKNLLNLYLVEDKDLTVQYDIYNVGGSSAIDTELVDKSFATEDFDVVHGSLAVKWQRIGPGANVSHVVIVKPKKSGYFNFTSADLSYLPSESATDRQYAYTSAPGEGGVVNFKDYDRKFSPHVLDWAAFAVMTLPSLGIPFLLWHGSKSKYEQKPKKS
jgi:translocon-associated protein subunit beta